MTINFQDAAGCRQRIFLNQCRYLERTYPFLSALDLAPRADTAEFVSRLYSQHIKTRNPFAAAMDIADTYRTLLEKPEARAFHPALRRWLARHYMRQGTIMRVAGLCDDPDIVAEAEQMWARHVEAYGIDIRPYAAAKSRDRGQSLIHYFSHHPELLRQKTIGHIAPEDNFQSWFAANKAELRCGYTTLDGFKAGMDAYVDLAETGLPGLMFDVIICHHVLEHIQDDTAALNELFRLLRPGGVLNISVPQNMGMHETVDWAVPDSGTHGHIRQYGADFKDKLEKAGFRVDIDRWLLSRPQDELMARKAFPMMMYNAFKP